MAVRTATAKTPKVPEIRKGDTVIVLSGRDAGKRGTVERVVRRDAAPRGGGRSMFRRGTPAGGVGVVVAGVNIAKRHTKPRQGSSGGVGGVPRVEPGGILEVAQPLPIGKVMVVCGSCDRPTRIAHATLEGGRRVRVCRHCGQPLEVKA